MAAPAAEFGRTLHGAMQSDAVAQLQEALRRLDLDPGEVDGIYGPRTARVVRAFQEQRGLPADGLVGPATWDAIARDDPDGRLKGTTLPEPMFGATAGEDVRWLQERLAALGRDPGRVDGVYGPDTESAVLEFQRAEGLPQHGMVDEATWRRLSDRSVAPDESTVPEPDDAAILARLDGPARAAIAFASATADHLGSDRVHMEHLLFGLFQEPRGRMRRALAACQMDETELRMILEEEGKTSLAGPPTAPLDLSTLPMLSSHTKSAVTSAWRLAGPEPGTKIGSGTLFAGALTVSACDIIRRLLDRGVNASPPTPGGATFAGFADDEPTLTDHLGFGPDVSSLATLLAAKRIEPPIAVGLFGDWGTGKSTFMRQLRASVREITAEAGRAEQAFKEGKLARPPDFCSTVRQVVFNAWSYVDTNLWAGLITRIFEGLAEPDDDEKLEAEEQRKRDGERRELLGRLEAAKELERQATERLVAADHRRQRAADTLQLVRGRLEKTQRSLASAQHERPPVPEPTDLLKTVARELGELIPEDVAQPAAESMKDLKALNDELRVTGTRLALAWRKAWHNRTSRAVILGAGVVALLLLSLAVWLVAVNGYAGTVAFLASVGTLVAGWMTGVSGALKRVREASRRAANAVRAAETEQQKLLQQQQSDLQQRSGALEAELRLLADEEARLRAELERAGVAVRRAEDDLEEIREGRRLYRFIQERATGGQYEKYQGIVALIRKDFRRLARLLADARKARENGDGPEEDLPPIDRIVLYIDDLDRCPADRVVQVLEAVHLLLAFPLFVVVVGVDSRWLLRSLERHYFVQLAASDGPRGADPARNLLPMTREEAGHWEATPQNYLEKIFQIAITIPRMTEDGFGLLVSDLLKGRTDEPSGEDRGGTHVTGGRDPVGVAVTQTPPPTPTGEVTPTGAGPTDVIVDVTERPGRDMNPEGLQVTEDELEFVKKMAPLVSTPRAAKRLVNTYRLIRAPLGGDDLEDFLGRVGEKEYRACLVLLSILIGFPALADDVFGSLLRSPLDTWDEFVETLSPPADDDVVRTDEPDPGGSPVVSGPPAEDEPPTEAAVRDDERDATRDELLAALTKVKDAGLPAALEVYRTWARRVARYSFQTVRLVAEADGGPVVIPDEPDPETSVESASTTSMSAHGPRRSE